MVSCKKTDFSKLVFVLLSLFLVFPGVMAQTVSFADPDSTAHKEVQVYGMNVTTDKWEILGSYNTTSTGIVLPNGTDIQFVIKPQYSNPLDDPGTFLTGAVGWLQTNVLSLLILAVMGGFLFVKRF